MKKVRRWIGLSLAAFLGAVLPVQAQSLPSTTPTQQPATSLRASLGAPQAAPGQAQQKNVIYVQQPNGTLVQQPTGSPAPANSVIFIQQPNGTLIQQGGQPSGGQQGGAQPGGQPGGDSGAAPGGASEGALEPGSQQAARSDTPAAKGYGPTVPEEVKILQKTSFGQWLDGKGIRIYGWADAGYTYASTGPGRLNVEPRENRFGNELIVNQLALVIDKPLKSGQFDWGFNMTYWAGADPSLIQPRGGIDDPPGNPRFSHDFRQLYLSAHLPILTEGGVDVRAGRMGTVIGYNSALAPYRPLYSSDYQWFYAQDGAFTGLLTNWHVNKQLDLINAVTLGANTFFTKRSDNSYCYLGQVNYWLQEEKKTLLSASIYTGENAIFAAPGKAGDWDTVLEFRVQQNWSKCLTQVVQAAAGFDQNVPNIGTSEFYGLYNIFIYHLNKKVDLINRIEWFDDVQGARTGVAAHYGAFTFGSDIHPQSWLRIRPEIRYDCADERAFGRGNTARDHNQFTAALELLFQF